MKLFQIFIVFLVVITAFFGFNKIEKLPEYKIIEIVEADKFYLDLNKNNKTDENEFVKLKHVRAFSSYKTSFSEKSAKDLNISHFDFLKLGVLAKNWAQVELLNKTVQVKGLSNCDFLNNSCYVEIKFDKGDLAKYLLLNGLAYLGDDAKRSGYYSYFNNIQIKNNLSKLKNIDFVIVNLKNGIVHNLNCEYASKITHGKLELKNKLTNSRLCKFCSEFDKLNFEIPKTNKKFAKSFHKSFDNIDLYFINPLEFKKPDSGCNTALCKRIVSEINNAKISIDIALYSFGFQDEIFNALKNAKQKGVIIRSVADFSKNSNGYHESEKFIKEFDSIVDSSESLMHNKFIIFDKKLVMSGSTNISSTGTGGYNSNISFFINDEDVVKAYLDEFEQMHSKKFSRKKIKLNNNFSSKIEAYFSPQDDILSDVIIPKIKNAKTKIYVSAFYLTDKKLIEELINAKKRGVEVLIIVDSLGASGFKNKITTLRENLIPTIVENWGGKNHEKTILIDDALILGSCNFSKSAFYRNDENIIVLNNKNATELYSDYFLYLFHSINKKFLHLFQLPKGKIQ